MFRLRGEAYKDSIWWLEEQNLAEAPYKEMGLVLCCALANNPNTPTVVAQISESGIQQVCMPRKDYPIQTQEASPARKAVVVMMYSPLGRLLE